MYSGCSQAEGTGRYRMQTREGDGDEQAATELLSLEAVVGPSRPSPRSPATEAYAAGQDLKWFKLRPESGCDWLVVPFLFQNVSP